MQWRRMLVVGGFLAAGVALAYISFEWRFMEPKPPGRIVDLPETQSPQRNDEPRTLDPTGLAPARGLVEGVRTWTGTLVDAGCRNRESYALQTPAPETPPPAEQQGVAAQVPDKATRNLTPDAAARQMDMGCAVTGATTAFSILLDNGQLKDLDEGGNTYAWEAVQTTPEGQALLAGKLRGVKPRAVLQGTMQNDEIIVESLRLERGQAPAPAPERTAPPRRP